MKLIVCLDDNKGMMFNKRRQSRDRVLIENILELRKGEKLYIYGVCDIGNPLPNNIPQPAVLLVHHPEYAVKAANSRFLCAVCGHAHGGQWRIFGRGVFAPHQGIFPKYTAGVIDGRCIISRGTGDHTPIPRVANPRELVIIHCGAKTENK